MDFEVKRVVPEPKPIFVQITLSEEDASKLKLLANSIVFGPKPNFEQNERAKDVSDFQSRLWSKLEDAKVNTH